MPIYTYMHKLLVWKQWYVVAIFLSPWYQFPLSVFLLFYQLILHFSCWWLWLVRITNILSMTIRLSIHKSKSIPRPHRRSMAYLTAYFDEILYVIKWYVFCSFLHLRHKLPSQYSLLVGLTRSTIVSVRSEVLRMWGNQDWQEMWGYSKSAGVTNRQTGHSPTGGPLHEMSVGTNSVVVLSDGCLVHPTFANLAKEQQYLATQRSCYIQKQLDKIWKAVEYFLLGVVLFHYSQQ